MMNYDPYFPDRAFKRQVRQIARALKIREDFALDLAYEAYENAFQPNKPGNIRREAIYRYAKALLNVLRGIDDEREKAAEAAYRARWDD